jgi:hypothetical protein
MYMYNVWFPTVNDWCRLIVISAAILFSGSCWYMKMQFLMSDFYRYNVRNMPGKALKWGTLEKKTVPRMVKFRKQRFRFEHVIFKRRFRFPDHAKRKMVVSKVPRWTNQWKIWSSVLRWQYLYFLLQYQRRIGSIINWQEVFHKLLEKKQCKK